MIVIDGSCGEGGGQILREHLADQLLLPLALAGGGVFTTVPLSRHAATNAQVIEQFLPIKVKAEPMTNRSWRVEVGR